MFHMHEYYFLKTIKKKTVWKTSSWETVSGRPG